MAILSCEPRVPFKYHHVRVTAALQSDRLIETLVFASLSRADEYRHGAALGLTLGYGTGTGPNEGSCLATRIYRRHGQLFTSSYLLKQWRIRYQMGGSEPLERGQLNWQPAHCQGLAGKPGAFNVLNRCLRRYAVARRATLNRIGNILEHIFLRMNHISADLVDGE